ncbi:hypothetical protein PYCC9005_002448 [Savitreella phatthalungensis]
MSDEPIATSATVLPTSVPEHSASQPADNTCDDAAVLDAIPMTELNEQDVFSSNLQQPSQQAGPPSPKRQKSEEEGLQSLLSAIEMEVKPGEEMDTERIHELLSTDLTKTEEGGVQHNVSAEDAYVYDVDQGDLLDEDWTRKRRWSGFEARFQDPENRAVRIRNTINDNIGFLMDSVERQLFGLPTLAGRITTISCAYAAVGQKSYGHERRYMTPPPYCVISGPSRALLGDYPQVFMSIHAEDGAAAAMQEERLDRNGQAFFRQLHINSATVGKSKSFHLKLQIGTKGSIGVMDIPFAEFDTPEISIISKASSRTSKLRLQNAIIYHDSPIALYNRINSQTVRTKYLNLEDNRMTVRSETWAPFFIQLVDEESSAIDGSGRRPILYGSIVTLYDPNTGSRSERMIVRRLHKNELDERTAGAASQMQKIILEREAPDEATGHSAFLSASSAQRMQKEQADGEVDPFTHWMPVDMNSNTIEVDDCVCWTLMGISQIQCSFLDTLSDEPTDPVPDAMPDVPKQHPRKRRRVTGESGSVATPADQEMPYEMPAGAEDVVDSHVQVPVTPFPTLADRPAFDPNTNHLFLLVRNFLQPGCEVDTHEIWLGGTGPMRICAQELLQDTDTDVSLELEMPTITGSDSEVQKLPLLFVRPDGLVISAACDLIIQTRQ